MFDAGGDLGGGPLRRVGQGQERCRPAPRSAGAPRSARGAAPRPWCCGGTAGTVRFSTRTRSRSARYGPATRSALSSDQPVQRRSSGGSAARPGGRRRRPGPRCLPAAEMELQAPARAEQPGDGRVTPAARRSAASSHGVYSRPSTCSAADVAVLAGVGRARPARSAAAAAGSGPATSTSASSAHSTRHSVWLAGPLAVVDRARRRAASAPRTGTAPGSSAPTRGTGTAGSPRTGWRRRPCGRARGARSPVLMTWRSAVVGRPGPAARRASRPRWAAPGGS